MIFWVERIMKGLIYLIMWVFYVCFKRVFVNLFENWFVFFLDWVHSSWSLFCNYGNKMMLNNYRLGIHLGTICFYRVILTDFLVSRFSFLYYVADFFLCCVEVLNSEKVNVLTRFNGMVLCLFFKLIWLYHFVRLYHRNFNARKIVFWNDCFLVLLWLW